MSEKDDAPVTITSVHMGKPGATAAFAFDRATVERFRTAFPKARWRDDLKAWFVPGTRAVQRLDRWLGRELPNVLRYADERGRDAFAFDPVDSRYLEAADDLLVRTPYSRTIVAVMREIPWASWDGDRRVWRVPFRSWEDLRRRWPEIEEAARRNEPEARRRRAENRRGTPEQGARQARANERRRRRYPVPVDALPPLERVIMTRWGALCFTEVAGECADAAAVRRFYGIAMPEERDLVWAAWRRPTHGELVKAWPARLPPEPEEQDRGWWQPTLEELRAERRKAKSIERARVSRSRAARTS
jgi:hypothetical protein